MRRRRGSDIVLLVTGIIFVNVGAGLVPALNTATIERLGQPKWLPLQLLRCAVGTQLYLQSMQMWGF